MTPRNDGPKTPKKNDAAPNGPDGGDKPPGPFDVRTVKGLVALMTQHDLSEIDLRDGEKRLRLRRGAQQARLAPPHGLPSPLAPPPMAALTAAAPALVRPAPGPAEKKLLEIKSPTPGTFYSSAKPGDPAFVKVGSKIAPETVVCLIEAMKIFNEIQAEVSGTLAEILVENQQPVEFGQVLFRVTPAG